MLYNILLLFSAAVVAATITSTPQSVGNGILITVGDVNNQLDQTTEAATEQTSSAEPTLSAESVAEPSAEPTEEPSPGPTEEPALVADTTPSQEPTEDPLLALGFPDTCYLPNQMLDNGTISVVENCSSMVECQSICRKTDECQSLSFVPLVQLCFLKNDEHAAPTDLDGVISAPVNCDKGLEYWRTQDIERAVSDGRRDYVSIGCWKDFTNRRAIAKLEGVSSVKSILDGNYHVRSDPIEKCYRAALQSGFQVFAVQNGGQCFSSADAGKTHNHWGESSKCGPDGEGGPGANEVYRIETDDSVGVLFTSDLGIIKSTNYPARYNPKEDVLYKIRTKCSRLELEFKDLDLEKDWDFLKIYAGGSVKERNLELSLTGNVKPRVIPTTIWGGEAVLWFTSDPRVEKRGFKIIYRGKNCKKDDCQDNFETCTKTCQRQFDSCQRGRWTSGR